MRAAVIAVGSELLLGDIINTNAAWLGQQLALAGLEVVASEVLADDLPRLTAALIRLLGEVEVVVLCGGLGPTVDDLTRSAVAAACSLPLERSDSLITGLRAKFAAFGIPMPDAVLQQADVPAGAEALDNPVGTAPGLWLPVASRVVIALPGPPHELRAVAAPVWPRLAALSGARVTTRQVLTYGAETSIAAAVEQDLVLPEGVELAYLASNAVVRVRFTTSGDPAALEPLVAGVDRALGDAVWGHDEDTLDGVVHALLGGQTVGVAESLTGGLLGARLSSMAGSSATFRGSLVVYATDLKESLAGVPSGVLEAHGAVSVQTAAALAEGARSVLRTDWGIGVTGVAGPTEQEGKPVGTVHLAVAGPSGTTATSALFPGDRERIRLITVTTALDLLRRRLL